MRGGWVKSSRSVVDNCVEVRATGAVEVRDTKDADGPRLRFSAMSWQGFVDWLRGSS